MIIETNNIVPYLEDISDFIKEHPSFHPDSTSYEKYWMQQLEYLLVGYWGKEQTSYKTSYRFMNPQLYYFTNFHTMTLQDGKIRRKSRPLLLDINWSIFNCWFICRGFSGFSEDKEYTSSWIVKLLEDQKKGDIIDIDIKYLNSLTDNCYKDKDKKILKKYIDPLEYLNKTHDKPLGIPLYDNLSLNMTLMGSRGGGKSFAASAIMEHEYLTDGAKSVDEYLAGKNKVEVFCGASESKHSGKLLGKLETSLNGLPGTYIDRNTFYPSPLSRMHSGTLKAGNGKNPYRYEYEKKIGNTSVIAGTGSMIVHENFSTNKQAAVGGRYNVLVVEEVGLEDSMLTVHGANESTMDMGEGKFGSALYIGTGGSMEKVIETEMIFRDPLAYDMLAFKDIYEQRGLIGYFLPATYTNLGFKDKNGNTDLEKAVQYEQQERDKKKQANNTKAYDEYVMSRPLTPSEIFLSKTGNKFPVVMLRNQQGDNDRYNYKKHLRTLGYLKESKDSITGVTFKVDNSKKPIDRFPHDPKSDLDTPWEFYEHPPAGLITPGLYKVVYDPIKDEGGGTSLSAIYVYKSKNTIESNSNELVAWWVGRLDKPDDIHHRCVLTAKYYNAQVMFENNIIDFKNYCIRTGNFHLLAPSPKQVINKAVKNPKYKYEVGIPMTTPLKEYAVRLLQQWLLEEKKSYQEEKPDGSVQEIIVRNLNTLKDDLLIDELVQYNNKGNFDRVSCMLLLMLWIEEEQEIIEKQDEKVSVSTAKGFYDDLYHNEYKAKKHINY